MWMRVAASLLAAAGAAELVRAQGAPVDLPDAAPDDAFVQPPEDEDALPEPVAEPAREDVVADDLAQAVDQTLLGPRIRGWRPEARAAALAMLGRHGPPSLLTDERLAWREVGPFARVVVTDRALPYEHVVRYDVPAAKRDDLARFDTAVTFDPARRTLAVRSATAPLGVALLNLVDDVVRDRASVPQARDAWDRARSEVAAGRTPLLARELRFQPQAPAIGR